jgi:predicted RNase H-like HicB family nuclease
MLLNYTAKYSKIASGYMGQLVEWPEVLTEGKDIEECRMMLRDALNEMLLAYKQQKKEIPIGGALIENRFRLLREGANHSIYTNDVKTIPVKRHRVLDRITANEICKQAGLKPKF